MGNLGRMMFPPATLGYTKGSTLTKLPPSHPMPRAPDPFEPTPLPALLLRHPAKLVLYYSYRFLNSLRSQPLPSEPRLRIVCISDTHNGISEDVPSGDILVHAGDMTNVGSISEIQRQVDWLASLPHKEIVVISGNHDTYLDPRTRPSLSEDQRKGSVDWKRVHYLQHRRLSLAVSVGPSGTESERSRLLSSAAPRSRRVCVYGAPQIPACGPMSVHAFQYERGTDAWTETVPNDTDILVTHTPPKYHRDLPLPSGMGCEHLMAEVKRVKPALHVFGHVHWGAGQETVRWDGCHDAYVDGMSVTTGWTGGLLSPRLLASIVRVWYRGLRGLIWDRVWGGLAPCTRLVNAAQMYGNTGKLGNRVQVVEI
ncbi:Metallo-dependent phosphatase [Westerdykella ornata]|uniref:Metallo-dependent phosphatase n=1 Tax=Westerdykella ornata TaxID=318751 RepID=A0A6A6JC16_WESOR|nr:Metallo-dependent phosphatase [Westerdykella ornata]KAF2274111.1 Metallo-dependent phosphatase [Westerdykella ornata]